MQRPKMPIKERAKIFAPFDALKGFREMLAQDEIIHEPRIEPSEDLMIELSNTINSLKAGMMIEVKYYVPECEYYKKITGIFTKIDKVYKRITIVKTKINIKDIIDIKITEDNFE